MNRDYQEIYRKAEQQTAEDMAKECTIPELEACAASSREDRDFEMMRVFNKAIRIQREMAADLRAIYDILGDDDSIDDLDMDDDWEFNPNL